ncbi:MAG: 1,4-beta-xylanase [Eubacteriales bacterium]|nr:1,4-beta-xylanase [Eubacteriales bacterium]
MSTSISSIVPYKKICGINFAPFCPSGSFTSKRAKDSLLQMKERTNANLVIFTTNGLMDTPNSEAIDFSSLATISDDELKDMIDYAQSLGLMVGLKPTVNCKNGMWRAHVNFFDEDVPCEPKWCNWFDSYATFQCHYGEIAQETGCTMLIAGCEMVMAERRADEWRQLIAEIRKDYKGPVSYNTDKYQEHNVSWWDCVDFISSSGYYPIHDWENQLNRIEPVVKKFDKPFLFAEIGCMSVTGSELVPNDWRIPPEFNMECQAAWYQDMFEACTQRDWVGGWAIWSWTDKLYAPNALSTRCDYEIYNKLSEQVIHDFYNRYNVEAK